MPDPLDPTDAIFSAFSGVVVRVVSFLGVGMGGQFVGEQIHGAPARLVALKTAGIRVVFDWFEVDVFMLPFHWLFTLAVSLAWWTFPLSVLVVGLFIAMWRDADLFKVLLILAVVQPINTFITQQRLSPLAGMDLSFAIGLLIAFIVATVALLLWWRRTSEALPDAVPEIDEL